MKISIEFRSLSDMLVDLPKFATVISGSGSFEERLIASGLDLDVVARKNQVTLNVTPPPGVELSEEDKTGITKAVTDVLAKSQTGDVIRAVVARDAQVIQDAAQEAAQAADEAKPTENTPKAEKGAESPQGAAGAADTWTPGGGEADDSIVDPSTGEKYPDPPAPEKKPAKAKAAKKEKAPDVTAIRKVMKACLDAGKRDEAKAILTSVGADNVTSIPEDRRGEVLERMTALAAGKE